MRPANTAICRISGFWDKGKKQAAPSNLSFPVPHPPAVHCSAIASRVPGSSASPFQLRLLGTGIKLAHNRIHVNTPLIAGNTFFRKYFPCVPKNVIARRPQATKQSCCRRWTDCRALRARNDIFALSLRGAQRRSNPVAGDRQIAAPFGLAMTKVKGRARNDEERISHYTSHLFMGMVY